MLSAHAIQFFLSATETITTTSQNQDVHPVAINAAPSLVPLSDGVGQNKAQKVGRKVYTLSTTPLDIDLTAFPGGLGDAPINFTKIKDGYIRNLDPLTSSNSITVGAPAAGPPANAWTNFINGTYPIAPNALRVLVDHNNGIAVSPTNKVLRLQAVSGTPQVEIVLIGEGS